MKLRLKGKRKCQKSGEIGHNSRTCLALGNRAGRGERAGRQEQEDWELDIMIEGIDQEVEAQVRHEAAGGDGDSEVGDSDNELSQLHSSYLKKWSCKWL